MTGRNKGLFLIVILTLVGLALFVRPGQAQKPKANKDTAAKSGRIALRNPIVRHAVGFAETKPAREIAAQESGDTELSEAKEINEQNLSIIRRPNPHGKTQKDGALQSSFGRDGHFKLNIPAPILTFEGLGVGSSAPPDTTGAVGPNDYVQTVNSTQVRVWDKTGAPRGPAFRLSSLFAPIGGVCAGTDNGDPIILYDRMANRWLISQFGFIDQTIPPYHQCIAVSKNGDPTGAYWAYDFETPGADFPDYPKFGAWPDAYYYTDRQFTFPGGTYNGFGAFAFERAKMLVGDPTASLIYFNAGPDLSQSSSGMIPTDFNGLTPPPAGAPNVFSVFNDDVFDPTDSLRLFDFHADFATPANSTFTERPESPLPVASFDSRDPHTFSAGRNDVEEPPPAAVADYLNVIGDRLMLRLQYINRGGTEMLTTVHTVNAGIIPPDPNVAPTITEYKAGTRYYILQKTTPGGAWSVLDQATFSPDTVERWMGSSALDNAGNLAVGYSTSNLTTFPSLAYAGRLATDPPNTLSGEQTMFAGTGVQQVTANRWGDYSNMSLDPSDDATFWYTSEYYTTSGQFLWRTRVGKFKFPDTVAPPQGTLAGRITACDTGATLKDALVQVSGGPSDGFSSTLGSGRNLLHEPVPGSLLGHDHRSRA